MRDDFRAGDKDELAKRVAHRCSNPGCARSTSGPREDTKKSVNIGVAAHIAAASPNGPRYDPDQTTSERRSIANGIWLCQTCAKLIDNDPTQFDVHKLRGWKTESEERAKADLASRIPAQPRTKDEEPALGLSSEAVLPAIRRLQDRFSTSLRPLLAGGQIIKRQQTQKVLTEIEKGETRIVVVHGVAGSGKSGVLLELADILAEQRRPFLPLRLDRFELRGTPRSFAVQALHLPGTPGECLASVESEARAGVLLVDQLDALRWTGAHSAEAWDVCREMILDALARSPTITVVVCCRSFDLQHDPQIRSWKEEARNLIEIQVGSLSDEQVQAAIGQAYASGASRPVEDRELKLLQHVHHLQMWLALFPNLGPPGSLSTRRALMEAFWQDRRTQLQKHGLSSSRIETIEVRLVEEMHDGARLAAPLGALGLSRAEVDAYQSLHIFLVDSAHVWVGFCHQDYLDYIVALRIVRAITRDSKSILAWLGPKREQSLFRREQVRLVLEDLRDRDADAYMEQLRALVGAGEEARFHLRLLCLQFLSQVAKPRANERTLIVDLLADPYWQKHVLGDVIRGQVAWFEVLDEEGILAQWLAGDDNDLRETALQMMLSVVETCGDRAARLLRPFADGGNEWTRRILWVLRFGPENDSESLFDLRLELTKQGADTAEHVDWLELAEKHPSRFLNLICNQLLALGRKIRCSQEAGNNWRVFRRTWHGLDKVTATVIPLSLRLSAWEMLFEAVASVVQTRQFQSEEDYVLESYALEYRALQPTIDLLRDLGRSLLAEDWAALCSLGERLAQGDRRREILFLDSLREGPPEPDLADWAIRWLAADPWRVRLRRRRHAGDWLLSGLLLERYAPVCSKEAFRRVEDWLLAYLEPDYLERYRQRDEVIRRTGDLTFASSLGRAQHALLPILPPDRLSKAAHRRLRELNRKFGGHPSQKGDDLGPQAGVVVSPLGHNLLNRMSDKALLKLATSETLRSRSRHGSRLAWEGDHFVEASLETIASDFRIATQLQPARFGSLVKVWPSRGHPDFLRAILSGLASPDDGPGKSQDSAWIPPSQELLEELISLPMVRAIAQSEGDSQVAMNLCDILKRYSKHQWTGSALEFVVWVARHHPDPSPDYYPMGASSQDSDHFNSLEINALNVTRGRAAFAVRSLLFEDPERFSILRPAIESLIHDTHPAIRTAALAACLPVINIDRDQAVQWFLAATSKGPDELLATQEAEQLFRFSYRTHLTELIPTLDRMVSSRVPAVMTVGAKWIGAGFLVAGEVENCFELCISGAPALRRGVAEVAASLLGSADFANKAKDALLRLSDDKDEKVAQAVATSFRHFELRHIDEDREAWDLFARSRAFQADPTSLLKALEKQSGDLIPFSDCLLTVGRTFAEELAEAARDYSRGFASDASHYLLPLLLRLYEQAKDRDDGVYQRSLDLWDRLLEQRVGSAMGLARELDRL